jgi:hypothetical protein
MILFSTIQSEHDKIGRMERRTHKTDPWAIDIYGKLTFEIPRLSLYWRLPPTGSYQPNMLSWCPLHHYCWGSKKLLRIAHKD